MDYSGTHNRNIIIHAFVLIHFASVDSCVHEFQSNSIHWLSGVGDSAFRPLTGLSFFVKVKSRKEVCVARIVRCVGNNYMSRRNLNRKIFLMKWKKKSVCRKNVLHETLYLEKNICTNLTNAITLRWKFIWYVKIIRYFCYQRLWMKRTEWWLFNEFFWLNSNCSFDWNTKWDFAIETSGCGWGSFTDLRANLVQYAWQVVHSKCIAIVKWAVENVTTKLNRSNA